MVLCPKCLVIMLSGTSLEVVLVLDPMLARVVLINSVLTGLAFWGVVLGDVALIGIV